MVVGMVNPHSPTATKICASTLQQSAVASAFTFFSTLVCKTSECSGMFQDSQIRVNLNMQPKRRCTDLPNLIAHF